MISAGRYVAVSRRMHFNTVSPNHVLIHLSYRHKIVTVMGTPKMELRAGHQLPAALQLQHQHSADGVSTVLGFTVLLAGRPPVQLPPAAHRTGLWSTRWCQERPQWDVVQGRSNNFDLCVSVKRRDSNIAPTSSGYACDGGGAQTCKSIATRGATVPVVTCDGSASISSFLAIPTTTTVADHESGSTSGEQTTFTFSTMDLSAPSTYR